MLRTAISPIFCVIAMAIVATNGSKATAAPAEDSAERACRGPAVLGNSLGLPVALRIAEDAIPLVR
jgi:hypothetical protein